MRLTCPNCQAQYEVDDGVIPDNGRDVQCSNCGQAWFQTGKATLASSPEAESPDAETDAWEEALDRQAAPEASAEAATGDTPGPAPAPGSTPRKALDENLLTILREEAEREAAARRAEGSSLETQPDLGLEEARPSSANVIATALAAERERHPIGASPEGDRVASLLGAGDDEEDSALKITRRELLPDIEEINSTLRATSDRAGEPAAVDAPATLARQRSGFRLGFGLMLLVAALGLGVYAFAPRIASAVPGLTPALSTYVNGVNHGRIWLDDRMRAMTEALQDRAG